MTGPPLRFRYLRLRAARAGRADAGAGTSSSCRSILTSSARMRRFGDELRKHFEEVATEWERVADLARWLDQRRESNSRR